MITYIGTANNPADSTTYGVVGTGLPTALAVTPPSMTAGDLMVFTGFVADATATRSISVSESGGQTWNGIDAQRNTTGGVFYRWWGVFNGTLAANPSLIYSNSSTNGMAVNLTVFRPTNPSATWSVDVAADTASFSAPGSPFDVTCTGQAPTAASSVTLATWAVRDDNTWSLQTGGWTNPGGQTQWRSFYDTQASLALAYLIQTSAAATGDVTNRQSAGDSGWRSIVTFSESSAGVVYPRSPLYNPVYRM